MIKNTHKLAIYLEGNVHSDYAKVGYAIFRFLTSQVTCAIDSECAGTQITSDSGAQFNIPVVADIATAKKMGADVLVLGAAPSGGRIPDEWHQAIIASLDCGMSVVNGLHDKLNELYASRLKDNTQWIWDVRQPAATAPPIASAKAASMDNFRVLMVGTDMAIGKMTTGLILHNWLNENPHFDGSVERNIRSGFLATGQLGKILTGGGIALDAYKVDHACGAVEQEVLTHADKDIVLIEGQGSLLHPGSSATLSLMRGGCVNGLIMCHRADKTSLRGPKQINIPDMSEFIKFNESVASVCGSLTTAPTIAVSLNTRFLSDLDSQRAIARYEDETNLPAGDIVKYGPEKVGNAVINFMNPSR